MTINISGISKLSSFGLLLLFALIFAKPQSWCSVKICFEAILFLYTFNVNLYIYISIFLYHNNSGAKTKAYCIKPVQN